MKTPDCIHSGVTGDTIQASEYQESGSVSYRNNIVALVVLPITSI